jgi:AcrR family transcriptional regulator
MSRKRDRIDPRVIRTRNLLRGALIELIPEKGYEAITVKDITERATLNRATFYLHYRDKDDLLERGISEMWEEVAQRLPPPDVEDGRVAMGASKQATVKEFEHYQQHFKLYRALLGERGFAEFIHQLQEQVYQTYLKRARSTMDTFPEGLPPKIALVLRYHAGAEVAIIQWWLENDMPYSPEEMAEYMIDLHSNSLLEALDLELLSGE